jgi:hypothetical protein
MTTASLAAFSFCDNILVGVRSPVAFEDHQARLGVVDQSGD